MPRATFMRSSITPRMSGSALARSSFSVMIWLIWNSVGSTLTRHSPVAHPVNSSWKSSISMAALSVAAMSVLAMRHQ